MACYIITTWDKKPYCPKNTFVGTLDEIFALAKEYEDCNLKCLEKEIIDACDLAAACGSHQTVEDKWHGIAIVPYKPSKSLEELVAKSQMVANTHWGEFYHGVLSYCEFSA